MKKLFNKILKDPGEYINDFKEENYGMFLISGPQQENRGINVKIGRLVQVRKEAGMFGSDMVFLRHKGSLVPHENQWFFRVKEEYLPELKELFEEEIIWDDVENKDHTYTIKGELKETGFIIPSKVK
jgi:hypothetical protein